MRPLLNSLAMLVLLVSVITPVQAQTMDYNLSQAVRTLSSLTSSLERLKADDLNGIKRLQKKMDKAIGLLETSESQAHPDYQPTKEKYAALQQQLNEIASGGSVASSTATTATQAAATTAQTPSTTMDYNLSQAIRRIESIETGLPRLAENDLNGFNRLSQKLNEAAVLMQQSTSQNHAEFKPAAQRWTVLQQDMLQRAAVLQQVQDQQQKLLAEQQAQQQAEAEAKRQAKADEQARIAAQTQLHAQNAQAVLGPMSAKYDRQSLPKLAELPTPEQARSWASTMHGLRTTQLESDVARIAALLQDNAISEEDARRTTQWISDGAQYTIKENIQNARMMAAGKVKGTFTFAEMINAVEDGDMNGAYRFAAEHKYPHNLKTLEDAVRAGELVNVYSDIFGAADEDYTPMVTQIVAALDKLQALKPLADEQAVVLENAEPARPAVRKDFLAPIAQEYWLEGDQFAESEADGTIWIDARRVGHVTNNGEIWVDGVSMGSIEPNGDVWYAGNQVGHLEANGQVWRSSQRAGLIESDGTVWINGIAAGDIEPFQGEWKRAAIVFYFRDFFVR